MGLVWVTHYKTETDNLKRKLETNRMPGGWKDDGHSKSPTIRQKLKANTSLIIHAMRDPLELVVSASQYHLVTNEKWVTRARVASCEHASRMRQ